MSRGGAPSQRSRRTGLLDRKQRREFLRWLLRPSYGDTLAEDGAWRQASIVDDPRMERFLLGHGPESGRDISTHWSGTVGRPALAILRIEPRGFEAPALELGYPLPSAWHYLQDVASSGRIVLCCTRTKRLIELEVTADFSPVELAHAASRLAVPA